MRSSLPLIISGLLLVSSLWLAPLGAGASAPAAPPRLPPPEGTLTPAVPALPIVPGDVPNGPPRSELLTPAPSPLRSPLATPTQTAVSRGEAAPGPSGDWVLLLDVPYRSQLDGTAEAYSDCGPASLGMVLDAYGVRETTERLRELIDAEQGATGPAVGSTIEALAAVARGHGLEVAGRGQGAPSGGWGVSDVRSRVAAGWPVIALTRYRSLPGNESSRSESDHYVVIVGLSPDGFFVHDPAFEERAGRLRQITTEQLREAWSSASPPREAIAFGPPAGELPLPRAALLRSELVGLAAPRAGAGAAGLGQPPSIASALPEASPSPRNAAPPLEATRTQPTATRSPRPTPSTNPWERRSSRSTESEAAPSAPPPEARSALDEPRVEGAPLVLAASPGSAPIHWTTLGLIGAIAAGVLLTRRPRQPRREGRAIWFVSRPSASWGGPRSRDATVRAGPRLAPPAPGMPVTGAGASGLGLAPAVATAATAAVCRQAPGIPATREDGGEPLSLVAALRALPDARSGRCRYPLASVIALAACAVLSGANTQHGVARWAAGCSRPILNALGIPGTMAPSYATIRRVFRSVDADALESVLSSWARERELPIGTAVRIAKRELRHGADKE